MTIESQADVEALQRIGRIVAMVLQRMLDALEPGMTTRELDALGARWLQEQGARSAPQLTYNVRAGTRISSIGAAIERTARAYQFKVIENLGSHGVGRALHEAPEQIPGYFDAADKRVLSEGMVITIEPFLSTKSRIVEEADDGWTLKGVAGNLSAQYEHTMIITRGAPIVVTVH